MSCAEAMLELSAIRLVLSLWQNKNGSAVRHDLHKLIIDTRTPLTQASSAR